MNIPYLHVENMTQDNNDEQSLELGSAPLMHPSIWVCHRNFSNAATKQERKTHFNVWDMPDAWSYSYYISDWGLPYQNNDCHLYKDSSCNSIFIFYTDHVAWNVWKAHYVLALPVAEEQSSVYVEKVSTRTNQICNHLKIISTKILVDWSVFRLGQFMDIFTSRASSSWHSLTVCLPGVFAWWNFLNIAQSKLIADIHAKVSKIEIV